MTLTTALRPRDTHHHPRRRFGPQSRRALAALAGEPLLMRFGAFVRRSEFAKPDADLYSLRLIDHLRQRRLISIRRRRNPHRIEARFIQKTGRAVAGRFLEAAE